MPVNSTVYNSLKQTLDKTNTTLVAVSKTKPVEDLQELYNLGQRDFGENYVQELVDKQHVLPNDIQWHFIGHLQSNKVKYIAPFVHLIHGVDSLKLLAEINKQALKNNRIINCLLQVHIAQEETKFGFNEDEIIQAFQELDNYKNIAVVGFMGMASFSNDEQKVEGEFKVLEKIFTRSNASNNQIKILSMGMSGDYELAIKNGSNMVRIGSLLFGQRG